MPLINSSFSARVSGLGGPTTLIEYLIRRFTYHNREAWLDRIAAGRVLRNDRPCLPGEPLRHGDLLEYLVVDHREPGIPTDYRLLYRDDRLALVHKPAGLPMHRTGRIFFQTLVNLLRADLDDPDWSPLNRLDRETGGITAFARGRENLAALAPGAPDIRWLKLYMAVVAGSLPRRRGRLFHLLAETGRDPVRCRMAVASSGKPSLCLYSVVAEKANRQLVLLAPLTGRKHQLRAQLAASGCPVVGDKIYAHEGRFFLRMAQGEELGGEDLRELGARHHLLHAAHLRLERWGQVAAQAWDLDWSEEFHRYFSPAEMEDHVRSPACDELLKRARETADAGRIMDAAGMDWNGGETSEPR